ncbi:hypothetical protein AX16_001078 [Volvariella volvacea WC 439]|nr:hypothetical protein AX16_001078 [Volvariella volvacea WC 439]
MHASSPAASSTLNNSFYNAYFDSSYNEYLNNDSAYNRNHRSAYTENEDARSESSSDSSASEPINYNDVLTNTIKRIKLIVPLSLMSPVFVAIALAFTSYLGHKDIVFYSTIVGACLSCLHALIYPTWGFLVSFYACRVRLRARSTSRPRRSNSSRSRSRSRRRTLTYTPSWATDFDNIGRRKPRSRSRWSTFIMDVKAYQHLFRLPHVIFADICALLWVFNVSVGDIWKLVDVRRDRPGLEAHDQFASVLACSIVRMLAHLVLVWIWVAIAVTSTREWKLKRELGMAYDRHLMQCPR